MRTLLDDARFGLRLLRKNPGFSAAALTTIALGIGANIAIFSVVRAVALRPLPYREPDRVVVFVNARAGAQGFITSSSVPDFEDWQRQATVFERMGLLSGWTFNLTGRELPERIFGARVTGSFFSALGAQPLLGRAIEPDDDTPGRGDVVVLSHAVWQRLFGGERSIIGQPVQLEGRPHVVVGVMPPDFHFPTTDTEIWSALQNNMEGMPRDGRFLTAIARLRRDIPLSAAQVELDTITHRLSAAYPATNRGWSVRLVPALNALVGDVRSVLFVLLAAVGLVLLIACANVSSLLLARMASRSQESAIRLALGATRGRLVRQVVAENLVLSLIGGALGVGLAYLVVPLLVALGPSSIPRIDQTRVDLSVLAFGLVLSIAAGIIPAVVPALRGSRAELQASLKNGFGGYAAGTGRHRLGGAIIVGEIAVAVVLAVAGGLLLRSFAAAVSTPPGFDPRGVLTMKVFLTPPRYLTISSEKLYVHDALERMAAVPGVEAAAAITQLPMSDQASRERFEIGGRPFPPEDTPAAAFRAVSASYFSTLRIPLLRGRALSEADNETSQFVIVINDVMARRFWPTDNPIGQRIRWASEGRDHRWLTIVGVAGDVKTGGLDKGEGPAVYATYTQRLFPYLRWTTFAVRTGGEPAQYALPLRRALLAIDANQPVFQVAPLEEIVGRSLDERRFNTWLLDVFAGLAWVLAAVGVYGAIGYWVTERAREIGVRMALGATAQGVAVLVIRRTLALVATGVVIGVGLSFLTSRALSSLLFNVSPIDPITFIGVAMLVTLTGIVAAYVPARRAARLDPIVVMR